MKKKVLFGLALALVMFSAVTVSCGKNKETSEEPKAESTAESATSSDVAWGGGSTGGNTSSDLSGNVQQSSSTVEVNIYMAESLEVQKYNTAEISYEVRGTTGGVVWTSSNESVATVENGVVKALKAGETVITATVGGKSATCLVTVTENPSFPVLVLSQYDAMPRVGGSVLVTANVRFNSEIVEFSDFTWSSADETIATVDGGNITGVAAGKTVITVTATYNNILLTEEIDVTVVQFSS
jgi:uncharacterized protein YjdB